DFYGSEQSAVMKKAGTLKIELQQKDGTNVVLKEGLAVQAGEVIDAASMSSRRLRSFIDSQISDAKESGVLFSLHLKATMMKVSDPIMFGIVVEEFYKEVLEKHADVLKSAGFNPNSGIG
ncbi:NADP-dependent isocitrate dehydrogenase, partial [Guyparkeria sp. 1SP6A2]|nr:NADP-dependent isocitrate dehydrogenase [Guyparkeria sp. 1SP6A2]